MEKRKFKTTKVLSGVRTEYRKWSDWDEEDTLVFKLLGRSQNRKNKTKKDCIVEVIEPFFADKKEEKRFAPGVRATLNTAGQFDKGMEQVEIGGVVQVVYKGSHEMTGGEFAGDNAYNMEVCEVKEDDGSDDSPSDYDSSSSNSSDDDDDL